MVNQSLNSQLNYSQLFPALSACCDGLVLVAISGNSNGEKCCYKSSHILPDASTENEAVMQARCVAACIDELPGYYPSELTPTAQGQWYSINFFQITGNCTVYQMILNCQRGCAIKSNNIDLTTEECRDQCINKCSETGTYPNTECNVTCNASLCSLGCEVYDNELNSIVPSLTLPEPVSSPVMVPLKPPYEDQYVYNVASGKPTNASSGEDETLHMTSFVFKIFIPRDNNSVYIWTPSSSGYLNLELFATCDVHISYKGITKLDSSLYSPIKVETINRRSYTEGYPSQVHYSDIQTYFREDFRDGYIGHALATFSWPKPENGSFLSNYRLTVFSQTNRCGGIGITYEYCIDKDSTNITIIADAPNKPLFFRCKYFVRLISEPTTLKDGQITAKLVNPESVSDPPATINLICKQHYHNNGKFDVYAIWTIPDKTQGLLEAIDEFILIPQLVDTSLPAHVAVEIYETISIKANVNKTLNVAVVRNLMPIENMKRKYKLRVETTSNHLYPWRHMPQYRSCIVDSHPVPPFPVNGSNIVIQKLTLTNERIYLNVSWEPAAISNGNITKSELRISRDYLQPGEEDSPTEYSYTLIIKGNLTEAIVNTSAIYQIKELFCLYLQIRAKNNYLWSNWSDPVRLSKYSNDPHCQGRVTSQPSTTKPTSASTRPTTQRDIDSASSGMDISPHIIGGVIGSLAGLVLIGALCTMTVVLCRRYRRRNRYLEAFKEINDDPMYIKGPMSPNVLLSKNLESPKLDEWEFPASQVVIEKRLGEGCFGEVFQGVIKGPINNPKVQASLKNVICPVVAIKLLKSTASGSEKVDFLQEIDTMKNVARGNNPHVVNMVGCVTIQEPLCLITEFVKHGDLLSYLKSIRNMITQKQMMMMADQQCSKYDKLEPYMMPMSDECSPVTDKRFSIAIPNPENPYAELGEVESVNLLSFAYQIASGMEFLASLGIVHRDLACRNILVGDGKSLKISDFGMSRMLADNDIYVKNTRGRLPWKWMAIESLCNREFTSASDVWAYGVTLWEIATLGGFPYPAIPNCDLLEHLQRGLRLEKPDNCSQAVYEIMLECWAAVPHDRPTFTSLRAKFDSLISAQQDHVPYIDLDIDSCKPYYTNLLSSDDEEEEKRSSFEASEVSTESSSLPHDIESVKCDLKLPMIENVNDDLPRPVSNAYVETPTKSNPYASGYDFPGEQLCSENVEIDLPLKEKNEMHMTEIA